MIAISTVSNRFIDRGDPSESDFVLTDMPTTGAWADLDLSAALPAGTKAVVIDVGWMDSVDINKVIRFRTKGNSNEKNCNRSYTQVAAVWNYNTMTIPTGGLQEIQYYRSAGANLAADCVIIGWFI